MGYSLTPDNPKSSLSQHLKFPIARCCAHFCRSECMLRTLPPSCLISFLCTSHCPSSRERRCFRTVCSARSRCREGDTGLISETPRLAE